MFFLHEPYASNQYNLPIADAGCTCNQIFSGNQPLFESISEEKMLFLRESIIAWGQANYADFPWRHTSNRWHALVAEIMLQRTRAEQVLPAYLDFTAKYTTAVDYAADPDARVFSTLGLNWREKYFRELASVIGESAEIPNDKDALLQLPGIGDYIASAYRSMHLGLRDVIIDSNVVRIYGRFFGFDTDGETRRKRWFIELADHITPVDRFRDYNYGLIDFTRTICKPDALHSACPVTQICSYFLASH
jgi:A/G-specific adenine glycosylase